MAFRRIWRARQKGGSVKEGPFIQPHLHLPPNTYFHFICMNVLLPCVSVHPVCLIPTEVGRLWATLCMLGTEPGPSIGAANALNHLPSLVVLSFWIPNFAFKWQDREMGIEVCGGWGRQADLSCEFDANLVYMMSFTQVNQSCTDSASNRKTAKERWRLSLWARVVAVLMSDID